MPIYPRKLKNGETVYDVREYVNGKQVQIRGLTESVAKRKRKKLLEEKACKRAGLVYELDNISDLAERWMKHKKASRKASTAKNYQTCLDKRICAAFGKRKIGTLTPLEIQEFIDSLPTPRVANNTLAVMRALFRWAESMNLAPYNPALAVKRKPEKKRDIKPLTHEQARKILAACDERDRLILATALYSGLRIGELAALTWSDFEGNGLRVRRTYGKGEFSEPKSENSRRFVYIPDFLSEDLEAVRGEGLMFPREDGKPLESWDIGRGILYPAMKKARIKQVRPHDLRHTYASWMIAAGVDLKFISAQLGHSTLAFTMDIYGHLLPNHSREMMKRFALSAKQDHEIPASLANVLPLKK